MGSLGKRLSLDQPAVYRILVQGHFGEEWSDWFDGLTISVDKQAGGPSITTLTGTVADQAALHGLLTRLYNLRLPLISIQCLGHEPSPGTAASDPKSIKREVSE
jgi:hypothetical protein